MCRAGLLVDQVRPFNSLQDHSLMTHIIRNVAFGSLMALVVPVTARAQNPRAVIETSKGKIVAELYADRAPKTVENFVKYAKSDFYQGTTFHRVIKGFMIQGGGFTEQMKKKETRAPIKNEADSNLSNEKYTLAMARTSEPDSATSQFFINTVDNTKLDRRRGFAGYAVFGKVIEGENVVQEIESVRTQSEPGPGGLLMDDVPADPVLIKDVKILEE